MRTRILAALAAAAVALGSALVATGAQAATDVTVTSTIKNHADNGHGSPSHWADDTWTRKTTIHDNGDGTYEVHLTGTGTFKTIDGAGSPSGAAGVQVSGSVTGDFGEDLTATVTGTPKSAEQLARLDGNVYDDANGVQYTTSGWIKHLFTSASSPSVTITAYSYTYERGACEKWVDASDNNDGQADGAGNITGKDCTPTTPAFVASKLTAANKCRVSKPDKRNWWTVTNAAGPRARTFWLHVTHNHRTTYEGAHTVAAGDTAPVRTSHGGLLKVGYYDGHGHHKVTYARSDASVLCKK